MTGRLASRRVLLDRSGSAQRAGRGARAGAFPAKAFSRDARSGTRPAGHGVSRGFAGTIGVRRAGYARCRVCGSRCSPLVPDGARCSPMFTGAGIGTGIGKHATVRSITCPRFARTCHPSGDVPPFAQTHVRASPGHATRRWGSAQSHVRALPGHATLRETCHRSLNHMSALRPDMPPFAQAHVRASPGHATRRSITCPRFARTCHPSDMPPSDMPPSDMPPLATRFCGGTQEAEL